MRIATLIISGAAVAALLTGCASGTSAPAKPADFTVTSAKPTLTLIDVGDKGSSVGDYSVFTAAVTKDGKEFGTLYGLKLLVALPGSGSTPEGLGQYQNQLTFNLPDGTISVAGLQAYSLDGSIPDVSLSSGETRAIVGGTGAYAGARGVVRTTASADGTRTQEFSFQ